MENTFNENQARADFKTLIKKGKAYYIQLFVSLMAFAGFVGLFSSIIIWIWIGWSIAWKVFLTSLIVLIFFRMLTLGVEKGLQEMEDKHIENIKKGVDITIPKGLNIKKSKFQQRLEELYEERKKQNNL